MTDLELQAAIELLRHENIVHEHGLRKYGELQVNPHHENSWWRAVNDEMAKRLKGDTQ